MKTIFILFAVLVFLTLKNQAQVVTDYDGNVYDTVVIENQVWLKQNLKTTHDNNGILIPNVIDSTAWAALLSEGRCYYNNDSSAYDSVYGPLYNWYVAHNSNVCPLGWRVPSYVEWQAVENILGGYPLAGGEMKEADTLHWKSPNTGATNNSGFTGLPGGGRSPAGPFQFIRENGLWWTSTSNNSSSAWGLYMWYLSPGVEHDPVTKNYGVSIRCMKDVNNGLDEIKDAGKCKLYPNPAKDLIELDVAKNQGYMLQVYNMIGKCVMQREILNSKTNIDISSLPAGTYVVKLIGETDMVTTILLKE